MFEKSRDPLAASVRSGVKTKYDRGEMISGEKVFGDRPRLSLYPPQPEPRITTRSRFWSLWEMAVECSTRAAGSLLVVENAWW